MLKVYLGLPKECVKNDTKLLLSQKMELFTQKKKGEANGKLLELTFYFFRWFY